VQSNLAGGLSTTPRHGLEKLVPAAAGTSGRKAPCCAREHSLDAKIPEKQLWRN